MDTRIEVDFNTRDESDNLLAPAGDAVGPVVAGRLVDCFDDEGNRCLGLVARVTGEWLSVTPLWATFVRPGEGRVVVDSIQSPPDVERLIAWTVLTSAQRSPGFIMEEHHRVAAAWPNAPVYPGSNTVSTLRHVGL